MSLVAIGTGHLFIPQALSANNASSLIDAASEVVGMVLPVWKAGNIRAIHWRTNTVTTGGANPCDVRVETVDASSGDPTGSLWGTNTNGSQAVLSSDDNVWFRTVLTADATVALGDVIAVLVANPATNFSNMNIAEAIEETNSVTRYPYAVNATRSAPQSNAIAMFLEYSDGTYMPAVGYCPLARGSIVLNTGTNPDEAGLYFTPDAPVTILGWGGILGLAAGADFRVQLYAAGDNNPLATFTHDGDITSSVSSGAYQAPFSSAVDLAAGTTYRLTVLPTTANSVTLSYGIAPNAAALTAITLANAQYTARNRSATSDPDTATWTETDTQIPCLWPLISRFDNGGIVAPRHYPYRQHSRALTHYGG